MGSALGCIRGENSGCSFCLPLIEPLINMYDTMFQREQTRITPVPVPSRTGTDDSLMDTYQSPPAPLAYDDPRCSHGQLVQRTKSLSSAGTPKGEKWYRSMENLVGPVPVPVSDNDDDDDFDYFRFDDSESDCPICLEEYTEENPKMELQCKHDFHLSCIYEWMERSEACPVCGKVMLFDESA